MKQVSRPWTEEQDAELRRRLDARQQAAEIARALGRTVDAVRGRAQVLRLTLTARYRPWMESPNRGRKG